MTVPFFFALSGMTVLFCFALSGMMASGPVLRLRF